MPSPLKSTLFTTVVESGVEEQLPAPLFDELVQAARDGDRGRFDECFDECFARLYAIAWRATQDQKRAERMTEELLIEVVSRPR